MTEMKGIFELNTSRDLLEKLRFDVRQLENDPTNTYLAFNFFVTAEHMKDWLYPGKANKKARSGKFLHTLTGVFTRREWRKTFSAKPSITAV